VAIVTGGTRGIGAEISIAMKVRLQGRGELRRQRRGGAAVQGRARHSRLQVERRRLRPACTAGIAQVVQDWAGRRGGEQRRITRGRHAATA